MAPYTPFKPTINPLVKQQASGPVQIGKPMGTAQPTMQPMQHNPALAYSQASGGLQGRGPGTSGAGPAVQTLQGPTSADIKEQPQQTPGQRLEEDIAKGYEMADKYGIGKEGSMGRLTDERKAEIDALLAKQQAGLDGMTPEEMRAAKELGVGNINSQLSTNMSMLGDLAAGNGVRGGSAVGLQMGALSEAQAASGQLSRQLILDNLAQKNIAMDRYGNTLQTQQGVGLGIQDANNQSSNAEKLARELAAGNYSSQYDSYRAGDKADDFTQQGIDISRSAVDSLKTQGEAGKEGKDTRGGQSSKTAEENFKATYGTAENQAMVKPGPNGDKVTLTVEEAANLPLNKYARSQGYDSFAQLPSDLQNTPEARKAMQEQNALGVKSDRAFAEQGWTKAEQEAANGTGGAAGTSAEAPSNGTIICTEAHRQGLLTEDEFGVATRYRKMLSMYEYKGYISWAKHVVPRMQAKPKFAKRIAPLVRRMIAVERFLLGETKDLTLSAFLVGVAVKIANYSAAYLRSLRIQHSTQLAHA